MEVNISSHATLSGGRRRLAPASGEEYVYVSTLTTIRYSNCPRLLSRLEHPAPNPFTANFPPHFTASQSDAFSSTTRSTSKSVSVAYLLALIEHREQAESIAWRGIPRTKLRYFVGI